MWKKTLGNFSSHSNKKNITLSTTASPNFTARNSGFDVEENSISNADEKMYEQLIWKDTRSVDKLCERYHVIDWEEQNLYSLKIDDKEKSNEFRVTWINSEYKLCKTYPSVFLVPCAYTDDGLQKLSKCYRHNR